LRYIVSCHGAAGDGMGISDEREKFLGVPSYKDRVITEGSIFHIVTYGINSMGSHANQVDAHERWLIADYVLKLKSKL
jgi:mono/diheme cytochrome c family protein